MLSSCSSLLRDHWEHQEGGRVERSKGWKKSGSRFTSEREAGELDLKGSRQESRRKMGAPEWSGTNRRAADF